ncbi:DNA polymerase [Rhodococcus sp. Leaf7]|uniref:DNA polymerase Y family protein n=1 Tax=unclassified Rhodococcus (in: high G+C Gram-positive bacteria) TaxID=192944 RepID=UPI0005AC349A|nr:MULTISPECIES: DNA polymerase Y family protein [unclassified Rhodococcus (in: high G+C Gram-positive bacteria)]KIQ19496.1 DNA polymerase [Rhodococcus sp. MEB064]KQU06402.1 DNA polymerase [Rhodococcus sp. Leaf7]KQU41920.1 DNA polymerase [Rhodococcus sp. Leaf247]
MTSPAAARRSRVLAVWCPDWPAVAAAAAADIPASAPVAVVSANRVVACSATARTEGVRRGARRRESQARCPELYVARADPDRDARLFEPVASAVDEVVPGIEVLRPGLLLLSARGAARYFGSEEAAAERLVDTVAAVGVECQVGIADEVSTAVIAARHGAVVPRGSGAQFLAPLPVSELSAEPSLAAPDRIELVDLLIRLGLRTVGDFGALSPVDVASRFGTDAVLAHRSARGEPERPPSARVLPPDLDVEYLCDPPIDRVDAAAFAGRALAEKLHVTLSAAAVACTRLLVQASTANGEHLSRTWRCAEPLTPEGTADRVRWQLDGWLTGRAANKPTAGIVVLRLEPVEVVSAGALQLGLWGGVGDEDERARRALVRVQGLLGGDAVQVGVLSGGRGPGERVTMLPWGDEPIPDADPTAPWPGRLPSPSPSALMPTRPEITVSDASGIAVQVTERGMFDRVPTRVDWGSRSWTLHGWAGPWAADERWWDLGATSTARQVARAQVLLEDTRALLVLHDGGRWFVEGIYE